jgi:hypothetical protein
MEGASVDPLAGPLSRVWVVVYVRRDMTMRRIR